MSGGSTRREVGSYGTSIWGEAEVLGVSDGTIRKSHVSDVA